ncbi:glutathione S-transferase family protein [Alphaproteobacteria bacterium]|jgi:glutathione S-transferase|nr:glutathione S-transferase family protein [Alphaproteobacteria bacterium]MDA9825192.1 glutathione S-transferase family protein [Alphaproteobacteria bacterium]MDB4147300.1 glutathione S-transferase family protein [Alphaproteobacteria bacterium]MDG2489302.1 glutathione S-transferase family protein [Alphaproteobacteria bacterium]
MTSLILHHYPQSPVAHKVRMALGIAGASWQSVEIPRLPPKPLLVPLTAGYRRTPVLQIGADIYCDSQNIALAIDQSNPPHSLFPDYTYGMAMMISNWAETTLFDLSVRLVLTHALGKVPEDFIRDRGSLYFEPNWTEASLRAALPSVMHELRASLGFVEAHLAATDGTYLNGQKPCYGDAALGYICWFLRGRWDGGGTLLANYPALSALEAALDRLGDGQPQDMDAEAALAIATAAMPQSPIGIIDGASSLAIGQTVMIRPKGETADPDVVGTLRYCDGMRISIDHRHEQVGHVAVHFPVVGYVMTPIDLAV